MTNTPDGNVFSLFAAAAQANAERAFLIVDGQLLLPYGGMLEQTGRAAAWLRSKGLQRGDRAIIQAHKSPAAVIFYLACLRAGVTFIPLNTAYQASELAYFLEDAEPSLLIASAGLPGETVTFAGERAILNGDLQSAPWAGFDLKPFRLAIDN